MKNKNRELLENNLLMVEPVMEEGGDLVGEDNPILQLQLAMATNSINHEYARMEYEDVANQERQEELLEYMNQCRENYLKARESLSTFDPNALHQFEVDLYQQKLKTLNRYNA